MKIGYARVSSTGQSLDVQVDQLKAAGCEKIYQEKRSGRSTADRIELERALDQTRPGDVLVVCRLDRLARSVSDLYSILADLTDSEVGFMCLQQGAIDTTTPTGKLMFGILGSVAEFENDLRRDRQREGIERAKQLGVYKGRPRTKNPGQVIEELRKGLAANESAADVARRLKIGRSTLYRIADEHGGLAAIKADALQSTEA